MTIALLDGDIVAYRASVATQEEDLFGQPGDLVADPQASFKIANSLIKSWTSGAKATAPLVVFSGSEGFRYSILSTYKHNRSGDKPIIYSQVVSHIEKHFKTVRKPRLEADDTIGILSTRNPSRYVAVSIDKDFASFPGRLFNPDKDAMPRTIKPRVADRAWLRQTLTGDSVDGYKGCPGIGPVKADLILDGAGWDTRAMWQAVLQAFLDKGLTLDDAVQQARVARILRNTDFDAETREIILWHPTKPTRLPTAVVKAPPATVDAQATPPVGGQAQPSPPGRKTTRKKKSPTQSTSRTTTRGSRSSRSPSS